MTTINGAEVRKVDIGLPNGVAHLIDAVLSPATSGNVVETLKADPEQRFTTFVKALKATKLDRELSDYSSEIN